MAQMPETIILRKTEETKTGVTYCMADVKTNADRIRSMSDEELVKFMKGCPPNRVQGLGCMSLNSCLPCWLDWLKQEADI